MARRHKGEERDIAVRRIDTLLALARAQTLASRGGEAGLADRYALLASRIATKYQSGMARRQKVQVCRGCHAYLGGAGAVRVRVHAGRIVTTCLKCGQVRRRPLSRRVQAIALP